MISTLFDSFTNIYLWQIWMSHSNFKTNLKSSQSKNLHANEKQQRRQGSVGRKNGKSQMKMATQREENFSFQQKTINL